MSRRIGIGLAFVLVVLAMAGGRGSEPRPAATAATVPTPVRAVATVTPVERLSSATPPLQLAALPAAAPRIDAPTAVSKPGRPTGPKAAVLATIARGATLRLEPSRKAAALGLLSAGTSLTEKGRDGSWRHVELNDGRTGWLHASAFEAPKPTPVVERAPAATSRPLPEAEAPSLKPVIAAAAIAALIVQESRASYAGACGCPDDRDRAGRRCGKRSAYSRAGGRSLFCYAEDVPAAMIARREASR